MIAMKTASMTVNQRDTLLRIEIVRDQFIERFYTENMAAMFPDVPNIRPSEWVSVYTLTKVHHLSNRNIKALVKKGYLEIRPTDGFGNEVRIKE